MKLIKNLTSNNFVKSVAVLMTGTVISQVISFLITPILTRIYPPEVMSDLNLYTRLVGFLAALATARYELSLPLPKRDEHSYLLYKLSLRIASYILLGVGILICLYFLLTGFDIQFLVFASLTLSSAFFLTFTNLGINWAIRKKEFKRISFSKILLSSITSGFKWLFGVFGWGSNGLLLASLIGFFISSITFIKEWFSIDKKLAPVRSRQKTKALAALYREFPSINLPHAMVDLGKDLLLAFFMIFYFSKEVFGWYSLSYSVLQMPISIIGLAIGQVFFSRSAELTSNGQSTLPLLKKTVLSLFLLSLGPFMILFFFGESLFGFVFGANWATAGSYSQIMTIWFIMGFLNSVVSTLPSVLHRQKEFFYLGIISAVIQITGFGLLPLIIGTGNEEFPTILWIVSIAQSIFFCYVLYAIIQFAKKGVKKEKL
ncbi:MAG: oligosaccharide flippase family protein [Crocinitomicaceae bacterium]|nr:oligosaccharide flippase family protein [Crocinitomicaceae bacterium]